MLQRRIIPVTNQIAPLRAVIIGGGEAENSVKIFCQARAVHRRKAFHADKLNTNQYSRVTLEGRLFIVFVFVDRGISPTYGWEVRNALETGSSGRAFDPLFGR